MKTYNRAAPAMQNLPPHLQWVISLSDEDMAFVGGAIQGARVSAGMTTQQDTAYYRIKPFHSNLEQRTGTWDFICDIDKVCIDSKSPSFNGNVPVEQQAHKYREANPGNYDMTFVISDTTTGSWPVEKFKFYGITITTLDDYINGKKK